MPKIITKSALQTKKIGQQLAGKLKGGEIFGLTGELGSGKTVFVQGLAKGLGIKKIINSPTFVLIKVYSIKNLEFSIKYLVHVDCYRLDNAQELVDIGIEDYLGQADTVCVIEWAERVKNILPTKTKWIKFELGGNDNERIIKIIK